MHLGRFVSSKTKKAGPRPDESVFIREIRGLNFSGLADCFLLAALHDFRHRISQLAFALLFQKRIK
jgi:hypothetical protein